MFEALSTLDLIFIVILAISTILGLISGAIREVLSLVGLAAAVYLAFTFADQLSDEYTSKFLESPQISYIVTFVLIIIATLFAVTLVNIFFSQLLKASGLSFINRFFGGIFGLIRGAIFCAIIVMALGFIPNISQKPWWQSSTLAPVFQTITQVTFKYLPKEVGDYFNQAKDSVDKTVNELGLQTGEGNADGSPTTQTVKYRITPNAENSKQSISLEPINPDQSPQSSEQPASSETQTPRLQLESVQ